MAKYRHPITDLSAGELSPKMLARFDTVPYQKGAQAVRNFLSFPQGGITIRGGTLHVGASQATPVRIIPFIVSESEAYLLELYHQGLRIWRGGSVVATLTAPWTTTPANVLRRIQVTQIEHRLVFVHASFAPLVLKRVATDTFKGTTGNNSGAIPAFVFNGPGLDEDVPVATWQASTAYASGDIVRAAESYYYCLKAGVSGSTGPAGLVGTEAAPIVDGTVHWRWLQEAPFMGAGNYPSVVAHFQGRLWMGATEYRPTALWASQPFDYGNFFFFDVVSYTNQQVKDPKFWYASASLAGAVLSGFPEAPTNRLLAGLTYYAQRNGESAVYRVQSWDGTSVTLASAPPASSMNMWTFSVWNDPSKPEYEIATTRRDVVGHGSGMMLELGSDQCDSILWLAPSRALVVGTTSAEWIIPPNVTALTPQADLQTRYGSAPVRGFLVNDAVVYLQPGARKLREYFYQNEQGAYQSPDLTFMADHVLGPGAVELEFSQVPIPTLWALRSDGVVAGLLLDKQSGARAWSVLSIAGGSVESIAVLPDPATGDDVVYLVVSRSGSRYIEKLAQPWSGHHIDGGAQATAGVAGTKIAVGTKFGATVDLVDLDANALHEGLAVAAGEVTVLDAFAGHRVAYGKLFDAELKTMPLAPSPQAQMLGTRPVSAVFRVYDSFPFEVGPSSVPETVTMDAAPFTGDCEALLEAGITTRAVVEVRGRGLPLTIVGLVAEIDVTEGIQ